MESIAGFGPYALLKRLEADDESIRVVARYVPPTEGEKVVGLRFFTEAFLEHASMESYLKEEIALASRLNHVNVLQSFDLAKWSDQVYLVEEFVDGTTLAAVLALLRKQGRPMPPDVAAFITAELCAALAYAHGRRDERGQPLQISHLDVRPDRVRISMTGEVKLSDFGVGRARRRVDEVRFLKDDARVHFMAPEIAQGAEPDAKADIFSVGAIAYALLTGKDPHDGMSGAELISHAKRALFPALREVESTVPEALAEIITRTLAPEPDARPKSATETRGALAAWLRSSSPGFGRHRLKAFLQKEVADALRPDLSDTDFKSLNRKDFRALDPDSLLVEDVGFEDGVPTLKDNITSVLAGAVSTRASSPPLPARGTASAPQKPPLPKPPQAAGERADSAADDDDDASVFASKSFDLDDAHDDDVLDDVGTAESGEAVVGGDSASREVRDEPTILVGDDVPPPRVSDVPGEDPNDDSPVSSVPDRNAIDRDELANAVYDDSLDPDFAQQVSSEERERLRAERAEMKRSPWGLIVGVVIILGLLAGGYVYVENVKADRAASEDTATVASVFVTSRPQGAAIHVDGQPIGLTTPAPVRNIDIGSTVALSVTMPGYDSPGARSVEIARGPQPTIMFEMEPTPHTIRVDSDPPGAGVIHLGRQVQETPAVVGPLRVDFRQGVDLILRMDGYFDERLSVEWEPGQSDSNFRAMLRPDPNYVPPEPVDE